MNNYRVFLWRDDACAGPFLVSADNTLEAVDAAIAVSGKDDWDSHVVTKY